MLFTAAKQTERKQVQRNRQEMIFTTDFTSARGHMTANIIL